MGCAIKKIRKIVEGMMMEVAYTVAQYHPPGNVMGEFKMNVGCANQTKSKSFTMLTIVFIFFIFVLRIDCIL